ncbi:MAG TPA: TadE family protein [Acidimicrobiales bacterium]
MLIEAAIVMPLLLTLVMGIIEFGMVFSDMQTVGASTRAGARAAVAYSRQANYDVQAVNAVASALTARTSGTPIEMWIYKVGSSGNDPASPGCSSQCQHYLWNDATKSWDLQPGSVWAYDDMNACTLPLDELGVRVRVKHHMLTGLFGDSITLTDTTVMRLEPQPLSVCP